MSTVIQRPALPDLTAQALREGIAAGRWADALPGEFELCREFQVGRETLRKAIARLVAEKLLLRGGRGHRHRIARAQGAPPGPAPGRVIRILTPLPPHVLGETHLTICDSLREQVERAGYRMELERHPRLYRLRQPKDLLRLSALPDTAGWVVIFSTEAIQRQFLAQQVPVVLMGPACPGIPLPSVWPDTAAAGRHAAGLFHARGHRQVVFLQAASPTLGTRRAEQAFVEETGRLGLSTRILLYDSISQPPRAMFEALLAMKPRPTAVLCSSSIVCLSLLCHLQNSGLRVPGDLSLLSAWSDSFMRCTVPTLAHYTIDSAAMGRQIARLLLRRIARGPGVQEDISLLPRFVRGESLGEAPRSGA